MNKLQTFFNSLIKSFSSPAYYKDVIEAKTSFSIKYLMMLSLTAAVFIITPILLEIVKFDLPGTAKQVLSEYPEELEVKFSKNGIEINQPLPYSFTPKSLDEFDEADQIAQLITFASDNETKGMQDVKDSQSAIYVTESAIYLAERSQTTANSQYRVYSPDFTEMTQPITVTKDTLGVGLTEILKHPLIKYKLYAYALGLIILIATSIGMLMGNIFRALGYGLVLMVTVKLMGKQMKNHFSAFFRVSAHTISWLVLYDVIGTLITLPEINFWIRLIVLTSLGVMFSTQASQMVSTKHSAAKKTN